MGKVLHAHKDSVVAVIAGHDHDGGYAIDTAGLHHITMNSPLIAKPGSDCFALLECHDDGWARFVAHGRACVESNTAGGGRSYPELILAKGVENVPEDDPASKAESISAAAVEQLMSMGFTDEQARTVLLVTGGNVESAVLQLVS